jgi:hypothetical protein
VGDSESADDDSEGVDSEVYLFPAVGGSVDRPRSDEQDAGMPRCSVDEIWAALAEAGARLLPAPGAPSVRPHLGDTRQTS